MKYENVDFGEMLHDFSESMSGKFSALAASLGGGCDKKVIRERWCKTCEEVKDLYHKVWEESL